MPISWSKVVILWSEPFTEQPVIVSQCVDVDVVVILVRSVVLTKIVVVVLPYLGHGGNTGGGVMVSDTSCPVGQAVIRTQGLDITTVVDTRKVTTLVAEHAKFQCWNSPVCAICMNCNGWCGEDKISMERARKNESWFRGRKGHRCY